MTESPHLAATRAAYDTVAVDYAELLQAELAGKPLDRALLSTFTEFVRDANLGPAADLGCGPGRVTAHLDSLGLDVFGIDLSPGMVAEARRRHPTLRFDEGLLTDVATADASLGGIVAWYSIIHTPPELLPTVFAEFRRILAPAGHLLLAFQASDADAEVRHIAQAYGHEITLDAYRHSLNGVVDQLGSAGFAVDTRVLREPDDLESTRQAYVLARAI